MANKKAAEITKEPIRIYLGPNLPNGRLAHATVFKDGIPAHLSDLRAAHPEVDTLIVLVSDMAEATNRLSKSGTPEYQAYQTLAKLSGKGS